MPRPQACAQKGGKNRVGVPHPILQAVKKVRNRQNQSTNQWCFAIPEQIGTQMRSGSFNGKRSLALQGFGRTAHPSATRRSESAADAAYPLQVLRNSLPPCCGAQNLCAALTAASNFDRCHSFLLAASATGGARKRPPPDSDDPCGLPQSTISLAKLLPGVENFTPSSSVTVAAMSAKLVRVPRLTGLTFLPAMSSGTYSRVWSVVFV